MKKSWKKPILFLLSAALLLSGIPGASALAERSDQEEQVTQFMDCIEPMPIVGSLSDSCWGAEQVGARDQDNGLEDRELENYCYWDGGIVKDEESGKYYMFASRWNQAGGHWGQDGIPGWQGSQAIYAVSDNLYGPYEDQGPIWPDWCEGAGHNVFPFKLSASDPLYEEGYRYGISISDTGMHGDVANGTIHISKKVQGPWKLMENGNSGKLKAEGGSGFSHSNISIMVRPDGRYEATNRNGDIALADSVAGTWEVVENGLWWKVDGMSSEQIEDPVIWHSDGLYHIVVNKWDTRMAYYLTSEDGISNWRRHPGTAYSPSLEFLEYEDGTANNWTKLERPNIYVEDGKIAAMTFAVIDVQKEEDFGNDRHGSKVIVTPFSSEKLKKLDAQPDPLKNRDGLLPAADTTAQTWDSEVSKNYGAEEFLQMQKDKRYQDYKMGFLGEGNRPDQWYDNKISYIKYDISAYRLSDTNAGDIESAYLSLIYKDRPGGDAEAARIQVSLCDADWTEGVGREDGNGNRADAGTLTWENQPALNYDAENIENTTAISDAFLAGDNGREVKIDVTGLVRKFLKENPGESVMSFALNVTAAGSRFRIASREAGDGAAPRLKINIKGTQEEKAGLKAVIDIAAALKAGDYTQESYQKLADALASARAAYEREEVTGEEIQAQIDGLTKAVRGLENAWKSEKEELAARLADKERELEEKVRELAQEREKAGKLTVQLEEITAQRDALQEESDGRELEIERLNVQIQELEDQIQAAEDKVAELETEKSGLAKEVNDLKKAVNQAREEAEKAKAEAEEAAKAKAEAEEALRKAQEEAEKVKNELEKIKNSASPALKKGDSITVKGIKYRVTDAAARQAEAYGVQKKSIKTIQVAGSVKMNGVNCSVTAVANKAFAGLKKAEKAVIGRNVAVIGKNAFSGDGKLVKIDVKSKKLTGVGKKALKGISQKAVIKVPGEKKSFYAELFKGKGQKKSVKIK